LNKGLFAQGNLLNRDLLQLLPLRYTA
jgi:hypothetical protein